MLKLKMKYYVSAVVNNHRESKRIEAVSKKQASYFFKLTYGFACRDLQVKPIRPINEVKTEQIKMTI